MGVTYDPDTRPGTSNLLSILGACTNEDPAVVAERYAGKGHGDLKADVADAVVALLERPRTEFERLRGEEAYLVQLAKEGVEKAMVRSGATMREVRRSVGLR